MKKSILGLKKEETTRPKPSKRRPRPLANTEDNQKDIFEIAPNEVSSEEEKHSDKAN